MLNQGDGRIAHIESEYNDIYVNKHGPLLSLTTRVRNELNFHSIVDLADPDALPVPYTRIMPVALLYPQTIQRILMVGLGAGSISTYLGRAMPDVQIDVVELDPGVIAAGRKYFGLQETDNVHFIESDGRIYLNRNNDLYDLILLDAYRELGVPFPISPLSSKTRLHPSPSCRPTSPAIRSSTCRPWPLCGPCFRWSKFIQTGGTPAARNRLSWLGPPPAPAPRL
jgi:hypothetical protein